MSKTPEVPLAIPNKRILALLTPGFLRMLMLPAATAKSFTLLKFIKVSQKISRCAVRVTCTPLYTICMIKHLAHLLCIPYKLAMPIKTYQLRIETIKKLVSFRI